MKIFKNTFFGILIGIANIIPGLSGATVALILGVYEKLINSVSSIKKKTIDDICKFRIKKLYNDLSLDFLIPIIIGICISAIIFAKALDYFELLEKNKKYTLSYFFVHITECDLKNEIGKKGMPEISLIFDGVFFKRSQYDL